MNGLLTTSGEEIRQSPKPIGRRGDGVEAAQTVRTAPHKLSGYLFGSEGIERDWNQAEIRKVISFVRDHRGIASLEEIMTLTGRRGDEAGRWTTPLLRDYDGEPAVTHGGALLYRFEALAGHDTGDLGPAGASGAEQVSQLDPAGDEEYLREEVLRAGQSAPVSFGNAMTLLSGLLFGTIAATHFEAAPSLAVSASPGDSAALLSRGMRTFATGAHVAHAFPLVALTVGVLPAGIASALFVLHFASARRHRRLLAEMRERYLRKQVYYRVLANPLSVDPVEIKVGGWGGAVQSSRRLVTRILDELAADYDAEIEESERGGYLYHFQEIERRIREIESVRLATSPQ